MDSEQARETNDLLQRDRKERGETRDAHLDAAREQAQKANAQARERNQAGATEDATGDEAQFSTGKLTNGDVAKAQARAQYEGSDEAFEQDWPSIRERLANEDMQKGVERIRRRL